MVSLSLTLSNIVSGQNIDDTDVTVPFNELRTHLENTLNGLQAFDQQTFGSAQAVSISAGAITATKSHVVVDTEAAAASDDLDTINGGGTGSVLYLRSASAVRTVVIRHNVGNIRTPNGYNITLNNVDVFVFLMYNGTYWIAIVAPFNIYMNFGTDTTRTISSGSISWTRNRALVDTEASATLDDLDNITGASEGAFIALQLANAGRMVRVRHRGGGSGNIHFADMQDRLLWDTSQSIWLLYDGTRWVEPNLPPNNLPPWKIRENGWYEKAAAATYESVGIAAGTNAIVPTASNDDSGTFVNHAITASAGTIGGRRTTTFNLVRRAHNPMFEALIRTGTVITEMRFWVGMFQAAPTNVDTLAASTAAMAFRYSTVAGDPGWVGVCNDGTSQSVTALVGAIAVSTVYRLRIWYDPAEARVFFQVNDLPPVSHNTNMPSLSTELGAAVYGITTTATAKNIANSYYGVGYG
ncbi:MAG: hypothetical protein JNJ61_10735 [Anaerolineae bacterium]|nr:hypothetical protein [Anaerolineae bacterium]